MSPRDDIDLDGCVLCRLTDWAYEEMADAKFCGDWVRFVSAGLLLNDLTQRRAA
jgi:hypothetical protein